MNTNTEYSQFSMNHESNVEFSNLFKCPIEKRVYENVQITNCQFNHDFSLELVRARFGKIKDSTCERPGTCPRCETEVTFYQENSTFQKLIDVIKKAKIFKTVKNVASVPNLIQINDAEKEEQAPDFTELGNEFLKTLQCPIKKELFKKAQIVNCKNNHSLDLKTIFQTFGTLNNLNETLNYCPVCSTNVTSYHANPSVQSVIDIFHKAGVFEKNFFAKEILSNVELNSVDDDKDNQQPSLKDRQSYPFNSCPLILESFAEDYDHNKLLFKLNFSIEFPLTISKIQFVIDQFSTDYKVLEFNADFINEGYAKKFLNVLTHKHILAEQTGWNVNFKLISNPQSSESQSNIFREFVKWLISANSVFDPLVNQNIINRFIEKI